MLINNYFFSAFGAGEFIFQSVTLQIIGCDLKEFSCAAMRAVTFNASENSGSDNK